MAVAAQDSDGQRSERAAPAAHVMAGLRETAATAPRAARRRSAPARRRYAHHGSSRLGVPPADRRHAAISASAPARSPRRVASALRAQIAATARGDRARRRARTRRARRSKWPSASSAAPRNIAAKYWSSGSSAAGDGRAEFVRRVLRACRARAARGRGARGFRPAADSRASARRKNPSASCSRRLSEPTSSEKPGGSTARSRDGLNRRSGVRLPLAAAQKRDVRIVREQLARVIEVRGVVLLAVLHPGRRRRVPQVDHRVGGGRPFTRVEQLRAPSPSGSRPGRCRSARRRRCAP